ncbi:MAG: hypothetical protein ACM358_17740, partial [Gemmatimonadota bacterium]
MRGPGATSPVLVVFSELARSTGVGYTVRVLIPRPRGAGNMSEQEFHQMARMTGTVKWFNDAKG